MGILKFRSADELKGKVNSIIEVRDGESKGLVFVNRSEFIFEGRLYDIISEKREGDKTIYECYYDLEEEDAIKAGNEILKLKNNQLAGDYTFFGFGALLSSSLLLENTFSAIKQYPDYQAPLIKYYGDIPSPPPKVNA